MRPTSIKRRKASSKDAVSSSKRLFLRTGQWFFKSEPHPYPMHDVEEMRRDYEEVRDSLREHVKARSGPKAEPWFEEILDREIFG